MEGEKGEGRRDGGEGREKYICLVLDLALAMPLAIG